MDSTPDFLASGLLDEQDYLQRNIGSLLGCVRSQIVASLDTTLHETGITGMQWIVLKLIYCEQSHTASDLCRSLAYDTGAMARLLDQLEKRGFICRQRSQADRRVINLQMSEMGKSEFPALLSLGQTVLDRHLRGFSEEEIILLKRFLYRMLKNGMQS